MKIATYNVNGIGGRLPVLLRWLALAEPDIVVLQELKAPQDAFPGAEIEAAGYEAIWHGQSRWNGVALLSRVGEIHETRRGLPGDPKDEQSRYIEAAVGGILVAGLYLPNGNPCPGPRFDYKLDWMERLHAHLRSLVDLKAPVVVAGDFNVIPTDADVYKPERWKGDALFATEAKAAYQRLLAQGWTDAIRHLHPREAIYTFWPYWRQSFERNAGIRIDHLLLNKPAAKRLQAGEVDLRPRGWDKTSDHTPVWVELGDAPSRKTKKKLCDPGRRLHPPPAGLGSEQRAAPRSPPPQRGQSEGRKAAEAFEQFFANHGWPPQWRDTVLRYYHYHSTAHEALGVFAGFATLQLGGPGGKSVDVQAGDALLLPVGTGHCRVAGSEDFKVVGAYPEGMNWDICTEAPSDDTRARMKALPLPHHDSVTGLPRPFEAAGAD